jgi:hypothetical protein
LLNVHHISLSKLQGWLLRVEVLSIYCYEFDRRIPASGNRPSRGQECLGEVWMHVQQMAMFEPESFRKNWRQMEIQKGELSLDLAPYATVRIDVKRS